MSYTSLENRLKIAELLRLGLTDRAIERATGIHRDTIGRHRRSPDLAPKAVRTQRSTTGPARWVAYRRIELHALLILRAVRAGAIRAGEVQRATGLRLSVLIPTAHQLIRYGFLCALDGEPWCIALRSPDLRRMRRKQPNYHPGTEQGPEFRPWVLDQGISILRGNDRRASDWREDAEQDRLLRELERKMAAESATQGVRKTRR